MYSAGVQVLVRILNLAVPIVILVERPDGRGRADWGEQRDLAWVADTDSPISIGLVVFVVEHDAGPNLIGLLFQNEPA